MSLIAADSETRERIEDVHAAVNEIMSSCVSRETSQPYLAQNDQPTLCSADSVC